MSVYLFVPNIIGMESTITLDPLFINQVTFAF